MKQLFKALFIVLALGLSFSVNAQTKDKIGHINSQELFEIMPGRDSVKAELEKYRNELVKDLEMMQNEFNLKYEQFMRQQDSLRPLLRESRAQELQLLQERINQTQQSYQQALMQKEEELTKPLIDKAREIIKKVANENGYTYIFDRSAGTLLHFPEGEDILPLVKKELGI